MLRSRPPPTRPRDRLPRPARRVRSHLAAATAALLATACSRAPVVLPPPPPPVPPSVLGIAVVEPVSDVADLSEAVRHVVAPDGTLGISPPAPPDGPGEPPSRTSAVTASPLTGGEPPTAAATAGDPRGPDNDPQFDGAEGPGGGGTTPATAADEATSAASDAEAPGDPALEPDTAPRERIRAAWERYCVSADLTPEQWGIIERTAMPASLQERWVARCRPEM